MGKGDYHLITSSELLVERSPSSSKLILSVPFFCELQGGGFRTFCRFFSCCFLSFIFVFLSVILTILMVSPGSLVVYRYA